MKSVVGLVVLCALLLVGAQFAEPQSVGGVPSRLRLASLGVGVAAPAGAGDATVQDDLTANDAVITATCTVAGSACLTRATNGRISLGQVNGATGALTNGFNATSASRSGVGAYSVNVTAAGFAVAQCALSTNQTQRYCIANTAGISTTQGVNCVDPATNAAADANFSFLCFGT